jgi:hypothetical protein
MVSNRITLHLSSHTIGLPLLANIPVGAALSEACEATRSWSDEQDDLKIKAALHLHNQRRGGGHQRRGACRPRRIQRHVTTARGDVTNAPFLARCVLFWAPLVLI